MTYSTYSGTRRTILVPEYVNNVTDSTKIVLLLVQESISRGSLDGIDSNFFLLNEHDNRHSTTLSTWPSFAKYIKGDWNNTATLYLNVPIFQPRCFCMPAEGDCTPLPVTREEAEDLVTFNSTLAEGGWQLLSVCFLLDYIYLAESQI